MFRIPGQIGKDLCDKHLGFSRRDILRVGGAGVMGLTLNNMFRAQAASTGSAAAVMQGWAKVPGVQPFLPRFPTSTLPLSSRTCYNLNIQRNLWKSR